MKKGFSYLEVLIVIVLFSIGIVALGTARVRSVQAETSVRIQKTAINDLEDFIEWVKSTDYDNVATGDTTFGATHITWQVNNDTAGIRGKIIIIEYSWFNRNKVLMYDTISSYLAER